MSLLTNVTRYPSAARLAAQVRIRASLVSVRKPAGRDGRITVVEFDVQRTALCPNRNRLIQPAVFESEIIEQP